MSREISEERRFAYYLGAGLMVVGFLLFLSVFVTGALRFGDFSNFAARGRSEAMRAISGMILIIVGGIVRGIGARGAAGSGLVLDPTQARRDLEPYSRMAGGMVHDALEETDLKFGGKPERVIMVKCRACGKLNAEDAKFCQECGKPL